MKNHLARLRFEALECRLPMAGDVGASVTSGRLELDGDSKGNVVEIRQLDPDSFEIRGVGTTVNGSNTFVANNVSNDFLIELGRGDDIVRFFSVSVPRHLTVIMGKGIDKAEATSLAVGGDTEINVGSDADEITVNGSTFTGKCEFHFNNGNDKLHFANSSVGAYCEFDSSTGADQMQIISSTFNSLMKIDTSADGDTVTIDGNCLFRDDLDFVGKKKGHTFNLLNSTFEGDVSFDTGDGDEQLIVRGSTFKQNFSAFLDEGADTVRLESCTFEATVTLHGEEDRDQLFYQGLGNAFLQGSPTITSFEVIA